MRTLDDVLTRADESAIMAPSHTHEPTSARADENAEKRPHAHKVHNPERSSNMDANILMHNMDANILLHNMDANILLHNMDANILMHNMDANILLHHMDANILMHNMDANILRTHQECETNTNITREETRDIPTIQQIEKNNNQRIFFT